MHLDNNPDYISIIKHNPDMIKYIKNQTYDLCEQALKKSGYALQFIKDPVYELLVIEFAYM